ncbi:hypothetical protein MNBD_GAMMA09-1054 [hydrothermal vent metagenome]|uniref:Uncharacterized protein n=1 Tax=hydrothermal vent metagenome TaxID=652676 RepID=A0A3B0Y3U7_9ZZZZ
MGNAPSCKHVVSFLWTNALVVGALVFLVFTFIDPADIAIAMMLDVDEGVFRIQMYLFSFIFLWLAFAASTFLNCYFARMKYNFQNTIK